MKSIISFLISLTTIIALTAAASNPVGSAINAYVSGRNKNGKVRLNFSSAENGEIVLRDLKDIRVHCEAPHPVNIDFDGYADFHFPQMSQGSSRRSIPSGAHSKEVEFKYVTFSLDPASEIYTGLYTCRGRTPETQHNSVSAHLYFPSESIFVSNNVAPISSDGREPLHIPCPVAEPNFAAVTLVKEVNEDTIQPVPNAVYDKRKGFTVPKSNNPSVEGTYYCIAGYSKAAKSHPVFSQFFKNQRANQSPQVVKFEVVKGPVTCTRQCGPNKQCQVEKDRQVCKCPAPYVLEPNVEFLGSCVRKCKSDVDCPKNMACIFSDNLSEEVAEDTTVTGRKECINPCVFLSTDCMLTGNDREQCRVVNHAPVCSPMGRL